MAVMTLYMEQHSEQQLQQEWSDCRNVPANNIASKQIETNKATLICPALAQRKFVVGLYSCPHESGNRLHRFMNGLVWAIGTNRTFLWRYHTKEAIEEYGEDTVPSVYLECDSILKRSDWVPSFDEWKERLGLPPIQRADLREKGDVFARPYDQEGSPKVIRTGLQYKPDEGLILTEAKDKTSPYLNNKERTNKLGELGVYFAFGMMFEALFTIRNHLMPNPEQIADPTRQDTYFLHSRHPNNALDGSYVWPEQKCLNYTLFNRTNRPCTFYLMSDRQLTMELLSKEISSRNCTVEMVRNHTQGASSHREEHGPFAGMGYWQDLALAIHARTGCIAFHQYQRRHVRTSTALVREIIEFRRVLTARNRTSIGEFKECTNPYKLP